MCSSVSTHGGDNYLCNLLQEQPEFIFMPPGGELRPLEQMEVRVIFTPRKQRSVRTVIDLEVEDGNSR